VAANKLDWYITPKVTLNVLPALDGSWKARLTVTIENPVPERTSAYVDGFYDGLTNGTHRTMVAVYLPEKAYDVHTLDSDFSEAGADPPLQMFAKRFEIPRGESRSVALEFSLPHDQVAALIIPSGRVHPVPYEVNHIPVTDAAPAAVFWVQPAEPGVSPGAPAVAALLALVGALAVLAGTRARLRATTSGPLEAISEPLRRAPALGGMLFAAALAVLVAGELISRFR
jgi:hypothetical protein